MKILKENFEIHNTLNKKIFNLDTQLLKDDVRLRLIEIADFFIQDLNDNGIPIDVYDYWLLGSNAAYNYTDESDLDIHIIVDLASIMRQEEIDPAILKLLYTYAKSSFNGKYDIKVKGYNVELYIQDINEPNATNGIYSLKKNGWIKVPVKDEPKIFDIESTDLYKEWLDRYNKINNDEDIEQFIFDLYLMRKTSLANEGEFGEGNLVFKQFRNDGILDELKDRKYQFKSKELTLESLCESTYGMKESPYKLNDLLNIFYSGRVLEQIDKAIESNNLLPPGFLLYSNPAGMGNIDKDIEHHLKFSHLIDEIFKLPKIQDHSKVHGEIRKQIKQKYSNQLDSIFKSCYSYYLELFENAKKEEDPYNVLRDKLRASEAFFNKFIELYNLQYKDKNSNFYNDLVETGYNVLKYLGY